MALAAATKREGKTGKAAVCQHHWFIESATDRTSKGVCRLCGAHRLFMNYLPDCLRAGEEEYEEWLRRQRDSARGGDLTEIMANKSLEDQPQR